MSTQTTKRVWPEVMTRKMQVQSSVKYLGHIVSEKGIETDPEKIPALKTWPKPNNLKDLKTFLGFCGYYQQFIKVI